jgi:ribosomal protein L7Ae-like RNA K-turn-binding protein
VHQLLNLLGLATRAGKIVTGEEFCVMGIRSGEVKYLFLASDAGVNTTKKITDKASFYNVEVNTIFSTSELSSAIGKQNRKVIGIKDIGFAKKMKEIR